MPDFSGVESGASSAQSDLARAMFQPQAIPAQPVNTGFFHDVEPDGPAEAGKPYGFPDGQQTPAQARGVRVALGAESPRLTERIAPESEGLAGTLGDMAQDVENVVRGIPSGGITGTGTFAADALGGTAFLPQNLGGTLARLALHQPVPELAGRDAARALTEGVAAPVRAFFQPEGTAGVVGEQVGALAVPGAALKGLAGLRALKAERDAARALESETLERMTYAPEDAMVTRQLRRDAVAGRAQAADAANAAAGEGMGRLAQTEARMPAIIQRNANARAAERQAAVEAYLREHPPTVGEDAGIRRGKPLVTPPPQERKLLTAGEPVRPSRPSAFGESRLDKLRTIMGERRAPVESPVPTPKASAPVRESELASLSEPGVATIRPTVIRGRRVFMGGAPRFRMTEDDALLARRRELLDRLDQAQEDIGKGTFEYVREDANSSGTERPVVWVGRKVTNEAGRAMGALKRDAALIAELDAELKGRGWNYEAIDRHMPASEASRLRSMREAARLDQVEANMRTRESLRQTARAEEEARAERYGIASEAEPVGAGATDFDPSQFDARAPLGVLVRAEAERRTPARMTPDLRDRTGRIGPVYHGSPHRFDKFSLEKIGTGEGNQAYGHGLYFAEREGVAHNYQRLGGEEYFVDGQPTGVSESQAVSRTGPDPTALGMIVERGWQDARDNVARIVAQDATHGVLRPESRQFYTTLLQKIDDLKGKAVELRPKGALYHAEINAEPDELLDWDKPFSQQSPKVQAALVKVYRDAGMPLDESGTPRYFTNRDPEGDQIYASYASAQGIAHGGRALAVRAADGLRAAGIKGIRYLDGVSRGAGQGTHNYVVFDDQLINILNREGKLTAGGLKMLTPIVTTGAGAATGAAADKDHPVRGAILGGALGLGAGLTAAGIASRAGRRGGVVMEAEPIPEAPSGPTTQQAIDDLLASVRPNAAARLKTEASAGEGIRQGPARPDTDQFVNVAKFSFTDPSGEQRLRQTVSHMVERGNLAPKGRVTWDQVKAEAAKLGLNPEALSRKKAVRMRGPDLLAIRNIVSDNLDAIERMGKQLVEGGSLTKAERATLASKMNALDAQNMNLLDKFTAARTQAGRDLNNLKIVAMRSNDPTAWLARAQQWAGKPIEPTTRDLIVQLAREGKVAEYLKLMQSLKTSGTLEKIGTFWRANLLTNPLTHVVNTTSNAGLAALETAKDVPGSIFDRLLGLATKQRTLSAPSLAQAKAGLAGARQGLREAVQVMKGIPLDEALQKFDFGHDVNFGTGPAGKIFNAYVQVPFRALGAADRVFKVAAVRYSLANQAEARGLNVASILANPPEDMMVQAVLDAAQATVQDQTTIGHLLRSVSKAGGGAGVFVVPFSRTPGAVATRAAEYTPIGFVTGGIKASKAIRAARAAIREGRAVDALTLADQREAAKLLGRATTGAGVIALGYWLADHGLMRGAEGEETAAERDTRYLTGTPEGAVKVGNTWASFGRLSPVGILLSVGANLHSIAKDGTTPDAAAASMAGTVAQAVTDQPFLTGIKNVIDIAQHPTQFSTAQKLGGDIATGFLPASAALGAVARGTDSYIRDAKGIREKIQSRIPGQAEKLDPLLDQFGQPVPREGGLTDALVNPFKRTTDRTFDPVLKEIDRLGVTISRRKPGGTRDRQVTRDLVAFEGPILYDRLAKLLQSPAYQRVNDAGKKALIERAIVTTRGQATRAQKDYLDQQAGVR